MHEAIAKATATAPLPRRCDAGRVRVSGRDIDGLILCGEMYGAPYDLLAAGLNVQPDRLRWHRSPMAGRRIRRDRPARARAGVVLADPPRPGRPGPAVRGRPPVARTAGAPARGPGRPPGAGVQPRRADGPALVALRTPYPRRGRRPGRRRPHPRRRSLLGRDPWQPLSGGTVGRRGRANPRAARPAPPPSWPGCCTAAPATAPARSPTTGRAMTAPSTWSAPPPAGSSPAPPPRCPTVAGPDNHPRPAPRGHAVVTLAGRSSGSACRGSG